MMRGLMLVAVLAGLAGPAAGADNPRVSLKVQDATAVEAADQLGKAAGLEIRAAQPPQDGNRPQRASFDWSATTLGRAMRELCDRFGLRPNRQVNGGYYLYPMPGPGPGGPPPKRVGLTEKSGVRLYVRSVNVNEGRGLNFGEQQNNWGGGNLTLGLTAELDDRDVQSIAGVENVVARDDLGNVLVVDQQQPGFFYDYSNQQGYPDEWSGNCILPAPHPKAKKLAWVEGDLVAFRTVR
ncbi:MAG TPA: hypothetical protein VFU47_12235, partial [Armatimonadota bacterium]|nr:hypothetical protein [Armatimonadota bacterium]